MPGPRLCPRVARAKLPRLSFDFAKTATPVYQHCLNELNHTAGPWGCPWVTGCSGFTFCCTTGPLPSRDPQSHKVHPPRHLPPHCQRGCVCACGVLLSRQYRLLYFPSISARLCWPPASRRVPSVIRLQGSQENPPHRASGSPRALFGKGEPTTVASFQCYPVACPPPPSLPRSPHWEDRSHMVAHGLGARASPPSGAQAPARVCVLLTTPALSHCVSPVYTVHTHGRQGASMEAGWNSRSHRNFRQLVLPGCRRAAIAADTPLLSADPADAAVTQQQCTALWMELIHPHSTKESMARRSASWMRIHAALKVISVAVTQSLFANGGVIEPEHLAILANLLSPHKLQGVWESKSHLWCPSFLLPWVLKTLEVVPFYLGFASWIGFMGTERRSDSAAGEHMGADCAVGKDDVSEELRGNHIWESQSPESLTAELSRAMSILVKQQDSKAAERNWFVLPVEQDKIFTEEEMLNQEDFNKPRREKTAILLDKRNEGIE